MSDLNPDARRLVDLARQARTPGEEDKLRIAERLAVPLAAGAALGTAAGAAKAAAGAGAGAKVAGSAALGSSGLGGFGSSIAAKIAALVAVGAVGTAVVVGQLDAEKSPAPAPAQMQEPTRAAPEPEPQRVVPDPAVESEPEPSEPIVKQGTPVPSIHKSAPELAQEAALLHQAQSAWRAGQSAEALQLANQHAERFPQSQLANERDVLRVLSLCKLGQVQAAKQVGARLLRKAKGSPWYQSVADSCAAQ